MRKLKEPTRNSNNWTILKGGRNLCLNICPNSSNRNGRNTLWSSKTASTSKVAFLLISYFIISYFPNFLIFWFTDFQISQFPKFSNLISAVWRTAIWGSSFPQSCRIIWIIMLLISKRSINLKRINFHSLFSNNNSDFYLNILFTL